MKTVLIYPSLTPGIRPRYGLQPLGILYLAARLKAAGVQVEIIDAEILGLTIEATVEAALASQPDLVGISAMTPQYPAALALAKMIKKRDPRIKVCLGGSHINATQAESLRLSDAVDFLVYGEGENTLAEAVDVLRRGDTLSGVKGVIYKDNGSLAVNPPRPLASDIDEFPFPDFRMVPLARYRIPYLQGRPIGSMILSRGCPYSCIFCDAYVTQGKKLRRHSPERIVREIKSCRKDLHIRNYSFKDSTFTLDRAWCLELLQRFIKEKLDIRYRCNTRVDRIDSEILHTLKASGCTMLLFGVESGSQGILDKMRKGTTVQQIRHAFSLSARTGIPTYASFMLGNIGETTETARQTIELAKAINPDIALFFFTTAYPGTDLYNQALTNSLVSKDWWIKEQTLSNDYAFSKWLSGEGGKLRIQGFDTDYWIRKAYRSFYFRPAYLLKIVVALFKNPRYIINLLYSFPGLLSFTRRKKNTGPLIQSGETAD
ncbi:MAG: radical SAM protein [Candidatus Aureabacteria bacterium]|nr:radical SAM protein [Candidatus Auribacterota bacterium]